MTKIPALKKCSKCGEEKDGVEFSKHSKNKDGSQNYRSMCKECKKECKAEYDKKNQARYKSTNLAKSYNEIWDGKPQMCRCGEYHSRFEHLWLYVPTDKNPYRHCHAYGNSRIFNLTAQEYRVRMGNSPKCKICEKVPNGGRMLAMDHDKATEECITCEPRCLFKIDKNGRCRFACKKSTRDFLCKDCNTRLGSLEGEFATKDIAYLLLHNSTAGAMKYIDKEKFLKDYPMAP